jgi:hypothetical protein
MGIFHLFHLFAEVETSHFVDFHPEMEVTLDWEIFISTLFHSPHIFFDGPWVWCMNFYKIVLVLDNYVNGFDLYFKVCAHIVQGHVSPSVSHLFSASWFIVLEK